MVSYRIVSYILERVCDIYAIIGRSLAPSVHTRTALFSHRRSERAKLEREREPEPVGVFMGGRVRGLCPIVSLFGVRRLAFGVWRLTRDTPGRGGRLDGGEDRRVFVAIVCHR